MSYCLPAQHHRGLHACRHHRATSRAAALISSREQRARTLLKRSWKACMSMSGTIARYNITRHERPCMQRSQAHPRSGLHDITWQQIGGVTGRTSRRPRARMPELGMLLWRSPLGTIGLCIRTNLRIRQRWTCGS